MKKLMIIIWIISSLQTYTVKGFVKDELGNSLAGVKILTLDEKFDYTDFDGSFTIKTEDSIGILKTSYFNFKKQEIRYEVVEGIVNVNIVLKKIK